MYIQFRKQNAKAGRPARTAGGTGRGCLSVCGRVTQNMQQNEHKHNNVVGNKS